MPLRLSKSFSRDGESNFTAPGDAACTHQYAQTVGGRRASKRTRSSSDTSPTHHEQVPETEEPPVHKRLRRALPWQVSTAATKPMDFSNVIDLTLDDSTEEEEILTSRRVPPGPKVENSVEHVRKGRGGRRGGRIAGSMRMADTELIDVAVEEEVKDQDKKQSEVPNWQRVAHNKTRPEAAVVMFTLAEARPILDHLSQGTSPSPKPPYILRTGEYIPFPVIRSYHLGGMGRYGRDTLQYATQPPDQIAAGYAQNSPPKRPRIMSLATSRYVFDWGLNHGKHIYEVPRNYIASILASPRLAQLLEGQKGLREALRLYSPQDPRLARTGSSLQPITLPIRPPAPAFETTLPGLLPNHPSSSDTTDQATMPAINGGVDTKSNILAAQAYVLTFGRYRGKMLDQVPIKYLQELEHNSPVSKTYPGLQAAVASTFKGLVENYRFDFGDHKGKQLHEVPDEYLFKLEGGAKKLYKSELLQRALWHNNEKLGRSNHSLSKTLNRSRKDRSGSKP